MSESNNLMMLESRLQELQLENNKLKAEIEKIKESYDFILKLAKEYISKDILTKHLY